AVGMEREVGRILAARGRMRALGQRQVPELVVGARARVERDRGPVLALGGHPVATPPGDLAQQVVGGRGTWIERQRALERGGGPIELAGRQEGPAVEAVGRRSARVQRQRALDEAPARAGLPFFLDQAPIQPAGRAAWVGTQGGVEQALGGRKIAPLVGGPTARKQAQAAGQKGDQGRHGRSIVTRELASGSGLRYELPGGVPCSAWPCLRSS